MFAPLDAEAGAKLASGFFYCLPLLVTMQQEGSLHAAVVGALPHVTVECRYLGR